MKLRLWIALVLVLMMAMAMTATMTLTALAEDALVIGDALGTEDAPITEDALIIEDTLIIEDALIDEVDLTLDDTVGLLPDDIASEHETAANGVEANTDYRVSTWSQLVDAFNSAKNGDMIIPTLTIQCEGNQPASIDGKTVTLDIKSCKIYGNKDVISLFVINNSGELVLKGTSGDKINGIMNGNKAVDICGNSRFTMESGTINDNNIGVYNDGVFTMKRGTITQNDKGMENYGAFIMGGTSGSTTITGNRQGVVTYFSDTALTVSGKVNITGNTNADVLLMKGQVVAVGGPLYETSCVGITLSDTNLPGPGVPVVVTRGLKGNGTAENFMVWGDYKAEINADGELEVSLKDPPFTLPAAPDATLLAKLTASGKRALHLTWTAVDGAQGYDVYFGRCGEKLTKVATVTDGRSCKLTGLKKGKTYRALVKAWTKAAGSKEYIGESSPKVYAIAGGYNNSRCNPKAVRVEKSKLSLKVGGSAKIKASVKGGKAGKKVLQKVSLVRYYSTNRNVATVSSSGKVTGVGVGSCKVWVVANNGVRKGVEVVVK